MRSTGETQPHRVWLISEVTTMSDVILSIVIFHSLCAMALMGSVSLAALFRGRLVAPARRLPVIARAPLAATRALPAPLPTYETLPAAA